PANAAWEDRSFTVTAANARSPFPPGLRHNNKGASRTTRGAPSSFLSLSDLRDLERGRVEQLLDVDLPGGETLLIGILSQRLDILEVLLDPVFPKILAHDRHGVTGLRVEEWQGDHQGV